jgi:hypothetical protein
MGGGIPKPNPSSSSRFFARPPSAWGPSTYVTPAYALPFSSHQHPLKTTTKS